MISQIEGILDNIEKDRITIDVQGVGYEIFITNSTANILPQRGAKFKLFTYLNVKEDLLQLYGFSSKEEKSLFIHLISVSGIGPKGAMNILSSFEINKLVVAITQGDVDLLSSTPGIGKKTAGRIVVELKEKIAKAYSLETGRSFMESSSEKALINDAVSALIALGYSAKEASQAILNSGADLSQKGSIEEVIKKSLKASI